MHSDSGTTDVDDVAEAYRLNAFCRRVGLDPTFAELVRRDPEAAVTSYDLRPDQTDNLLRGDVAALFRNGVHPVLLARLATAGILGIDETNYPDAIRAVFGRNEPTT